MTSQPSTATSDDRVMEAYYAEVRKCVMLRADEERALFKRYRTCTNKRCGFSYKPGRHVPKCPQCDAPRDFTARDKLIHGALRFVVKMAKEYARRTRGATYPADYLSALVSAGNLGLLVAVDRFKISRGTRFLTYAAFWVREKIREELDNMGVVRVPAYRQKQLRARRKQGEFAEGDEADVHIEEISTADAFHSDETLEVDLLNEYGATLIHQALDALELRARDKYIVMAYFGSREDPKNLRQISARLNLSSERVRQIKQETLKRLKKYLIRHEVKDADDVFAEE